MRLRRGAVNFIRQQDIAENRPRDERPAAMAGSGVLFNDVGAGDVGRHQIRRELDAFENQAQRLRDGSHHQRLSRAGQARDQAMAADKQRDQNLFQHLFLSDNHLSNLFEDLVARLLKALNTRLEFRRIKRQWSNGGHESGFLFPVVDFKQHFLGRAEARRGFQSLEQMIFRFLDLLRGPVGPGDVIVRRGLVLRAAGERETEGKTERAASRVDTRRLADALLAELSRIADEF